MNKFWTKEKDNFLKENYPKNGSRFCAEKLEQDITKVVKRANSLGLKVIKIHELIDFESFIKMDTPEAVYIAGFIYADGFCRKNKPQISIHISRSDMEEIYPTLCKFGLWNYSKYQSNQGRSAYVHTANRGIYNFFSEMGYKEKSYMEPTKILNYIPENLRYMFWRGFIEGDGTWYCSKPGRGTFSVVAGKEYLWTEFIKMLNELGIESFGINRRTRDCGSTSCVSFSRFENLKIFGEYIYQNREEDKIGLTRKYNKFLNIMNKPEQRKIILTNIETQEILEFTSLTKASNFLHVKFNKLKEACLTNVILNSYLCEIRNPTISIKNNNEVSPTPCHHQELSNFA